MVIFKVIELRNFLEDEDGFYFGGHKGGGDFEAPDKGNGVGGSEIVVIMRVGGSFFEFFAVSEWFEFCDFIGIFFSEFENESGLVVEELVVGLLGPDIDDLADGSGIFQLGRN